MKLAKVAVVVAALFGGASAANATTVAVDGDPVLYWNEILLNAIRTAGTPPPVAARGMAIVNVAIHDAINSTSGRRSTAYLMAIRSGGNDTRAAAATAAHAVLSALYPAQQATFDAALAASLALSPGGYSKTRSKATGAAIAAAVLAHRAGDGWDAVVPYTPGGEPGDWRPTPPGFVSPPALPQWPAVTPWVMAGGADFRPPPPHALGSADYAEAYNEVMALGAIDSAVRTADETEIAFYWADGAGTATPPGHWLAIATDVSLARGLSTLDNAQLFALMSVAMADAAIAAWDAKYVHDFWRPVTGIELGDFDGNDATVGDPGWMPLITTPPFPAYVSGHSSFSAAAGRVMALSLGDDTEFCSPQEGVPVPITRCWSSFSEAVAEAGRSRIYGGIHWAFDDVWGRDIGGSIGDLAFRDHFRDIPEPPVLMLFGLGIAAILNRRRKR
jgi:hypothetical protein